MDDYHPSPMGNWPAPSELSVGGRQSAIGISDKGCGECGDIQLLIQPILSIRSLILPENESDWTLRLTFDSV